MSEQRASFSHLGFIIAAAGSAIGLGNIWKFPYITYANDGGSFVLIYLAAVVAIRTVLNFFLVREIREFESLEPLEAEERSGP